MEESFNKDPQAKKEVKTSTDKSERNPDTTPDSMVQDGKGIIQQEHEVMPYDKSDEQQEYIDDAKNTIKSK